MVHKNDALLRAENDFTMPILNLFKYYAPQHDGKDNLSFYTQGEIYFQNPIKFNDPWDCNAPCISVPRQINSLRNIHYNIVKPGGIDYANDKWKQFSQLPRAEMKRQLLKLFTAVVEMQRSRIGVFSLSFIPDSELMWSHYAEKHTGFALHFQIDMRHYYIDPSLKEAYTPILVKYSEKRLDWNLEIYFNAKINHVYDLIRYKSMAWSYECELRLLNVNTGGFLKIPHKWLKAIIAGIRIDKSLQDKLIDAGKNMNIPVLSASMNEKNYKVDIPGLGINGEAGKKSYQELIHSKQFELR